MAVTLRATKGSALTWDELDANFNSLALLAGSTSQTFSVATATSAAHAVRLDQLQTLPRFSAYSSTSPSITSSVFAKLPANTEEFDIGGMYDAATNYRFTPTVAGYYFFSAQAQFSAASGLTRVKTVLYKNGAIFKSGNDVAPFSATQGDANTSALIYMNGTTDYVEAYVLATGTTPVLAGGAQNVSYFQGFLTGL